jgi:DNA-binding NarL/FixJ family response regulator
VSEDPNCGRVLLIDDHEILAQSLRLALEREGHAVQKVEVGPVRAMLDAATAFRPDVVLLDLDLGPAAGPTLPLIPRLRELGACVVMLTGVTDPLALAACVEAGADGLADKSASFESLLELVDRAVQGMALLAADQRERLLAELRQSRAADAERLAPLSTLTRREAEVLRQLVEGKTAEAIAAESFIALSTVRTQIRAVLQKLGVNSQLAAVAIARRANWPGSSR